MNAGNEPIYKYQPLWGGWKIDGFIGKGSYGSVYKVSKEELGYKYISAVKIITVPSDEQYREAKASMDDDERTLSCYFQDIVSNIIKEINLLYEMRGNSNIISYEDHMVIKKEDDIGWDILLRMEHATSFTKYLAEHQLTLEKVIQLGIDVCSALCTCEKAGVIHRDIKDENIFVSDKGVFKLGDFGIARELSKSGRAASRMGTPLYMAPEVFRGEKYNHTVDIYSLGIVMYKLLNFGRLPFLPDYPADIRYKDSEAALDKRMAGVPLPGLKNDYGKLASIILKACSFNPNDRYSSALNMKKELEAVLEEMEDTEKNTLVTLQKGKDRRLGSNTSSGSVNSSRTSTASPESVSSTGSHSESRSVATNDNSSENEMGQLPGNETIYITGEDMPYIDDIIQAEGLSEKGNNDLDKTVSIFGNTLNKGPSIEQIADEEREASSENTQIVHHEKQNFAEKGTSFSKKKKLYVGVACVIIAAVSITVFALNYDKKLKMASDTGKPADVVHSVEGSSDIMDEPASTDETITSMDTSTEVAANATQSTTNVKTEMNSEVSDTQTQSSDAATSTADTKNEDTKPQTQENKATEKETTKKNNTSTAKTPAKTTKKNNEEQNPITTDSEANINDFKLYITYGEKYTLKVTSPKNGQKYTYIFKAKENKGDDLGVISVTSIGSDSFSWSPPKKDTYYFITLQVKGLDGQITGVSE